MLAGLDREVHVVQHHTSPRATFTRAAQENSFSRTASIPVLILSSFGQTHLLD